MRELGDGMVQDSYCFYVDGVRISNFNIKKLLEDKGYKNNEPFDLSVYDKNRILFLPYSTQKTNDETVPALLPIDNDLHTLVGLHWINKGREICIREFCQASPPWTV